MKLKVFDRILLGILLIAAILVSFVLFGVAANLYFPFAWIGYVLAGSGKQTPGGAG